MSVLVPIGALLVAGFLPPPRTTITTAPYPPISVLTGHVWHRGDDSVDKMLELAARDDTTILYRSDDPDEGVIDLWLILNRVGFADDRDLRLVAYIAWSGYRDSGTANHLDGYVCVAAYTAKTPLVLLTSDPDVKATLEGQCTTPPIIELIE